MSLFAHRSQAKTLEELQVEWEKCQACPFYVQRRHVVMGQGKVGATIFAVGQSPAKEEDQAGIPFQGKGGLATRHQFDLIQIPAEEVFWTNVLACMPFTWMGSAGIRAEFSKNCHDRLEAELLLVKPKMIVAMGTPAAERFLSESARKNITGEYRGRYFTYRGIPGVTILHPAIIMRVRGMDKKRRQKTEDDLRVDMGRVQKLYREIRGL